MATERARPTIRLHGVAVPTDIEGRVLALSRVVYGRFDVRTADAYAHRHSVKIALAVLDTIDSLVSAAEAAEKRPARRRR